MSLPHRRIEDDDKKNRKENEGKKKLRILVVSALLDEMKEFEGIVDKECKRKGRPLPLPHPFSSVAESRYASSLGFIRVWSNFFVHHDVEIVTYCAGDMASNAAVKISSTITLLEPDAVIMVGICAADRNDASMGDVLISNRIYQYDIGKIKDDGFMLDGICHMTHSAWRAVGEEVAGAYDASRHSKMEKKYGRLWWLSRLSNGYSTVGSPAFDAAAKYYGESYWIDIYNDCIRKGWITNGKITAKGMNHLENYRNKPGERLSHFPNSIRIVPFASGQFVISGDNGWSMVRRASRKVVGVDMESGAVASICQYFDIPFVVVKGVSDYGDSHKGDSVRKYAAHESAMTALQMIEKIDNYL